MFDSYYTAFVVLGALTTSPSPAAHGGFDECCPPNAQHTLLVLKSQHYDRHCSVAQHTTTHPLSNAHHREDKAHLAICRPFQCCSTGISVLDSALLRYAFPQSLLPYSETEVV